MKIQLKCIDRNVRKRTSDMCSQWRLKSVCASAQSDQSSLSAWTNFAPLAIQKCVERRFWSDCTNAQADLKLRWAHMSEGTFFDVRAYVGLLAFLATSHPWNLRIACKSKLFGSAPTPAVGFLWYTFQLIKPGSICCALMLDLASLSSCFWVITCHKKRVFTL